MGDARSAGTRMRTMGRIRAEPNGGGMMRVVEIRTAGGPEVLSLAERPRPVLHPGTVRVRIAFSGLNRADVLQRWGRYPAPPGSPQDVPGLEFAGVVAEVGEGCELRKVGDRVMGILGGGGYAEETVVPERETIRVPEGLSLSEAAAIPEVFMTAWDALCNQANLRMGESLLIHAVGSGVGTAAIQLARALGAQTLGTSRTPEKVEKAREMGLHHGIVAGSGAGWAAEVREILGGRGVDVILDLVGGAYIEGNLEALGELGRWVVVGVTSGAEGQINLLELMTKRATVRGTVLRARPPEQKAQLARDFERTVIPLFDRQLLEPVVDRIFPAEQVPEAHRMMEANESFGKILLSWEGA